jgi:hypothetical protein
MDNVLPLASRRVIVDLSALVHQEPVNALFTYFEDALMDIFKYYATAGDQLTKNKDMLKSTSVGSMLSKKSFDDQKELFVEAKERSQLQNSLANQMGYSDFMRFASDFGMTNTMGLTCLDLGDIYLVVISLPKSNAGELGNSGANGGSEICNTSVRKLDYNEFWEALVRCAIVAFKSYNSITTEDKVKNLFLYIWRHVLCNIQDQSSGKGNISNSNFKAGLLRGSQRLNEKFLSMWARDGHRDYLDPPAPAVPSHTSMISNMLSHPGTVNAEDNNNNSDAASGAHNPMTANRNNSSVSKQHSSLSGTAQRYLIDIDVGNQFQRDSSKSQGNGESLGDDRISPAQLKRLLQLRPDITKLLSDCIIENNIK